MHKLTSNLNNPIVINNKSPLTLKQQQISSIKPQLKTLLKSLNVYRANIYLNNDRIKKRRKKRKPSTKRTHTNRLPTITLANLRSLNNKLDQVNTHLQDAKHDINCFTETWLTHENSEFITNNIDKDNLYHVVSTMRQEQTLISSEQQAKKGGGLITLIKREYASSFKLIPPIIANAADLDDKLELHIIRVYPKRLPRGYSSLFIINVYLPVFESNKKQQAQLINQLSNILDATIHNNEKLTSPLLIIAGDFNGANTQQLINAHKLKIINSKPTRSGKCLDIILTNAPLCYTCHVLPPFGNSDHQTVTAWPISAKYRATRPVQLKKPRRSGRIKDTVHHIRQINWEPLIKTEASPQTVIDAFYGLLKDAEDLHQPIKMMKVNLDAAWMTPEIKALIEKRQRLYFSCKSLKTEWDDYKKFARTVAKSIAKRKKEHFKKFTLSDPDWWDEVKNVNNSKVVTPISNDLANKLNIYFHSVWTVHTQPDLTKFLEFGQSKPSAPIFTLENVGDQLKKLKPKSAGPDGVNPKLIKSASLELVIILTYIFNLCIANSFVPSQWKSAFITPIPKVRNPLDLSDYRPIANLACFDKIFQRILVKFILNTTKHIWINNKQFGFLPARCTMDAIVQVIEDFARAKDLHKQIIAIFFDFAKAFDLVDHEVLLNKLKLHLPSWLVSWIAAYLTNRRQRVISADSNTDWLKVEAGVIQGSVIGPILFIIFISDINSYIPAEAELQKYADDILSYVIGDASPHLPQQIANGVDNWCIANKMRLNTNKCKVMIMNCPFAPEITLNKEKLEVVHAYKYLGIMLNDKLDWDSQWQRVQKLTRSIPYLIKQLKRSGFQEPILISVYRSLALSHITYSAAILTSASANIKNEMEHFHKRTLKIINITPANAKLKYNLVSIAELIDNSCLKLLVKILNDENHPTTQKLTSNGNQVPIFRRFRTKIAKSEAYNNTFLQKYLRLFRDGSTCLYKQRSIASYNTNTSTRTRRTPSELAQPLKSMPKTREKLICEYCGGQYKGGNGLASHQRLAKKCQASKHEAELSQSSPYISAEILSSTNITQRKRK